MIKTFLFILMMFRLFAITKPGPIQLMPWQVGIVLSPRCHAGTDANRCHVKLEKFQVRGAQPGQMPLPSRGSAKSELPSWDRCHAKSGIDFDYIGSTYFKPPQKWLGGTRDYSCLGDAFLNLSFKENFSSLELHS